MSRKHDMDESFEEMMERTGCADTNQNREMFYSDQYQDDDYSDAYSNHYILGEEDPHFYYNEEGECISEVEYLWEESIGSDLSGYHRGGE